MGGIVGSASCGNLHPEPRSREAARNCTRVHAERPTAKIKSRHIPPSLQVIMPNVASSRAPIASLVVALASTTFAAPPIQAQTAATRAAQAAEVPASMSLIRKADLERDLYYFASDSMRGREGGTPDEMRASIWIADELRKIGVAPAAPDSSTTHSSSG